MTEKLRQKNGEHSWKTKPFLWLKQLKEQGFLGRSNMKTREEALSFALSFPETYRDTPFKDTDNPSKRVYEAVKKIPKGKVATYKQVAKMAGNEKMCRFVGNALHKNPDPEGIPCYRVVNARGELAKEFAFGGKEAQEERLRKDGIEVADGKVDLKKYGMEMGRDDV